MARETVPGEPGATRTLLALRLAATPKKESVRVTFPLNPLILATVMIEVPCEPFGNDQLEGLAEILISARFTVIVTLWDSRPFAPLTMRV